MRAYLAINVMGCFGFDAEGNLVAKKLFPKKAATIAEKLNSTTLLPEEKEVIRTLKEKGAQEIITDRHISLEGIHLTHEEENIGKKALQDGFRGFAISLKWVTSQAELNEILSEVQVLRTKSQLREESRDRIIMRVSGMIQELDVDLNSTGERLREWYGLYFPELSREVQSQESYLSLIAQFGNRDKMTQYAALAKSSSGMEFSSQDIRHLQDVSRALIELYRQKKSLEDYIETLCQDIMPTTARVAEPLIAARMIAQAGGLKKLSRLPSSTIQLLGAEKALFRHLKGGGKAPKFGILFGHPLVQKAPLEKKGKVARLIAAKISLASRTDFYGKKDKGTQMRQELNEEVQRAV